MDTTHQLDAGLSRPLARPGLLLGQSAILASSIVGGGFPPLQQWTPAHWAAVVAIVVVTVLETNRRPGRLPQIHACLAAGAAVAGGAFVIASAGSADVTLTLMQIAFAGALLVPRGHPVLGSVAGGALLVTLWLWGTGRGFTPIEHLNNLAQALAGVAACWVIRVTNLSLSSGKSAALSEQVETVEETGDVRSAVESEQERRRRIAALVEPLLVRLSEGETVTDAFRAEVAAANEEARDLLRRDLPRHPELMRAVSAARKAGASVQLIGSDDRGESFSDELAARLADVLSTEGLVSATIRFLPASRGGTTSVLLEDRDGLRRLQLDPPMAESG